MGRVDDFDGFYIYIYLFFFLLKVLQVFKPRLERWVWVPWGAAALLGWQSLYSGGRSGWNRSSRRPQKGFILQRKGYLAGKKKTQQASLVQSCVSRAGVGRGGLGWNRLLHPSDWGFSTAIMRDLTPVCKISPFHHFSRWFFWTLWICPGAFPPSKKETQAPPLGSSAAAKPRWFSVWIFRVDFPCPAPPSPSPGAQSQFGAVPAATRVQELRPNSRLSVTFWERLEMGERHRIRFKKIPTPFLCNFPEWRGLRSVCFEQRWRKGENVGAPSPCASGVFPANPTETRMDGRGSILLFQGSLLCLKAQGRLFLVEKHTFIAF